MSVDFLAGLRNQWIVKLTSATVNALLPSSARVKAKSLLADCVAYDNLTLATTLTQIAAYDASAHSSRATAELLITSSLIGKDVSAADVERYVVIPVVRQVRQSGVPWRRWWDIAGLHTLLVELWAGQRLARSQPENVSRQLQAIWKVTEGELPALLTNSINPFPLLPPDLSEESLTGVASQLIRDIIIVGDLEHTPQDWLSDYRSELGERPDLVEVARRIRLRDDFKEVLLTSDREIDSAMKDRIFTDISSWNEQLRIFLVSLTAYELNLLRKPDPGTEYRDECLLAGRGYLIYSLLGENSLPPRMKEVEQPVAAPKWIQDEIISGGARMSHASAGPYPVWLFTAETRLGLAAVERLQAPGQRYGVGGAVVDNGALIVLRLPIPDCDPGPEQEVVFYYPFDYVDPTWQLLHLVTVGYARMVVLAFSNNDELVTRGSILISLPNEMREELMGRALTALRSHVGDNLQTLLWQRATVDPEEAASAAFHANEVAKSEELLDDAITEPPAGADAEQWSAFQNASRGLARARAQRLSAGAANHYVPELDATIDRAVENRQRLREIARVHSRWFDQHDWERNVATALPDDRSAFIHFFIKDDVLNAVYLTRENGNPVFGPIIYTLVSEESLQDEVEYWNHLRSSSSNWSQVLQDLLGQLAEHIIDPIFKKLQAKNVRRIFISPTPPLDLLPLHAVPVTINSVKWPFIEAVEEVCYMPTTRMLAALSTRPASTLESSLIVAHSGESIPHVRKIEGPLAEAELLHDIYPQARIMSERAATPVAVLSAMSGCRIIHVGCHAYTAEDRWASGLVLQGNSLGEAILSAGEVLSDGDLIGTDVIILNACRTGSHQSTSRIVQKLRGLEAVFLARGARAVISTFWEIDDLAALVFAAVLHESIAIGIQPGRAYRAGIAYLRNQGWHGQKRPEDSVFQAEILLDQVWPGWRDRMDAYVLKNPLAWSSFKITGLI